jgi:hypothetical protein
LDLVEGRSCGECSACCIVLPIDTPEMRKAPGMPCRHCIKDGGGCGFHAERPKVCRTYHCAWRYLPNLDETWRPDQSGVLIEFQETDIPAGYDTRPGIRLGVIGPIETVFKKGFLAWLMQLIEMDVPTFLAIQGPLGHYPANTFLNDGLRDAVQARDMALVVRRLMELLNGLTGFQHLPVSYVNAEAPDFGLMALEDALRG